MLRASLLCALKAARALRKDAEVQERFMQASTEEAIEIVQELFVQNGRCPRLGVLIWRGVPLTRSPLVIMQELAELEARTPATSSNPAATHSATSSTTQPSASRPSRIRLAGGVHDAWQQFTDGLRWAVKGVLLTARSYIRNGTGWHTGQTVSMQLSTVNALFTCPITQELMHDPVVAADGYTYERAAIETWLSTHDTSPMTNVRLPHKSLAPSFTLRSAIQEHRTVQGLL